MRLFYTEAQAEPAQAEAVGNRLTVSGRVNFRALYAQGDLTRVRCAEGSGDFSRVLTITPGEGSAAYTPHCEITSATARVFNGRLLLRAEINVTAQADAGAAGERGDAGGGGRRAGAVPNTGAAAVRGRGREQRADTRRV